MRVLKLALPLLLAIGLFVPITQAQNRTRFAGRYNAIDYAYGIAPGIAALQVYTGNTTTGTASVTVVLPCTVAGDGTTVCPLSTNAPIVVGTGASQDIVTPTAVSNCNYPAAAYGSCTVTASFNHTHGAQESITSDSYGLQEAINLATTGTGGIVVVDKGFAAFGGTNSTITSATGFSNVAIEDTRTGDGFWSLQPSTLNSLAIPTTLTSSTVTFAGTGTWNATYHMCVTYIDALGGEGPCSLDYSAASGSNTIATFTSPAASTGAVGWRAYAGASYNAAYLVPITSTNCTLTILESVMPACAIGSNAVFSAPPATTTNIRPNATVTSNVLASPTVNIAAPQPISHTTFAYAPAGVTIPQVFQTNYGPFPQFGALTSGQISYIGSVNLPTGFLNTIYRTVRLSGKIALTGVNTAALPTLTAIVSWAGGDTAGVGVSLCEFEGVAAGATKAYNGEFTCTLTTNAVGATAVGSLMTGGFTVLQDQAIGANGLGPYVDQQTAAVGSLGLFAQDTINIVYTSTTNATADEQLLDLHVEVLQ